MKFRYRTCQPISAVSIVYGHILIFCTKKDIGSLPMLMAWRVTLLLEKGILGVVNSDKNKRTLSPRGRFTDVLL